MFLYSLYGSKFNKETLLSLQYEFTVPELIIHQEYLAIQEALEAEQYKIAESRSG